MRPRRVAGLLGVLLEALEAVLPVRRELVEPVLLDFDQWSNVEAVAVLTAAL